MKGLLARTMSMHLWTGVLMSLLAVVVEGRVVYLFRHCVRSVNASSLAPFAGQPFVPFGVPPNNCLPRGLTILENVGHQLRAEVMARGAGGVAVVADDVPRNIDSMHALARGLGLPEDSPSLQVDSGPFARCSPPARSVEQALLQQRLKAVPLPVDDSANLAVVDAALRGLRNITTVPDAVVDATLKGQHALAATAATTFLMQLGGGVEVAWGRLTPPQVYRLDQMQAYDWAITRRAVPIERPKSSTMVAAVLAALGGERVGTAGHAGAPHTTIFVGHDTDVNGVGTLLQLGWSAPPLADNTTAPSVALRFESLAGGKGVRISFLSPTFTGTAAPGLPLRSSPVSNDTVAQFCNRTATVDWHCAGWKPAEMCAVAAA